MADCKKLMDKAIGEGHVFFKKRKLDLNGNVTLMETSKQQEENLKTHRLVNECPFGSATSYQENWYRRQAINLAEKNDILEKELAMLRLQISTLTNTAQIPEIPANNSPLFSPIDFLEPEICQEEEAIYSFCEDDLSLVLSPIAYPLR